MSSRNTTLGPRGRFTNRVTEPSDPANKHKLAIARKTMKLSCVGCSVLGGPNHHEARSIIEQLTRAIVAIDSDCTCERAS